MIEIMAFNKYGKQYLDNTVEFENDETQAIIMNTVNNIINNNDDDISESNIMINEKEINRLNRYIEHPKLLKNKLMENGASQFDIKECKKGFNDLVDAVSEVGGKVHLYSIYRQ